MGNRKKRRQEQNRTLLFAWHAAEDEIERQRAEIKRLRWYESAYKGLSGSNRSVTAQIDKLASFIMDEIPGEPSESEGAIDCAIRLLREREDCLSCGQLDAENERLRETIGELRGDFTRIKQIAEQHACMADAPRLPDGES